MSLSKEAKFANECRIGMKWKVKRDVLKDALKKKQEIESESFRVSSIPGVEYYLCLDLAEKNPNEVYIYLHLDFEMTKKISATFTISVKTASYENILEDEIYVESTGYGDKLCTRDELFNPAKKFFVDGYMEVELGGTLKSQGIKRKASESLSLVNALWKNDNEKDITIVAGEQEIKIHKWVLSTKSPVFKAEMESGFKEAKENKIEISDFCFETVIIAVEHFYEREINDQITDENASELFRFADKYDVEPLHDLVQNLLIDKLCEKNVVQFANMSITSNAQELRECCICFLMTHNGKLNFIKNITNLDKELFEEIGRRSFFGLCE